MNQLLKNTEVRGFKKLVEDSNDIVLTAHVRPDGDAVGSTLGLYHLLKSMGKNVAVVLPDSPPKSLSFLQGFKDIAIYTRHGNYCRSLLQKAELVICCDFNKPSRQDSLSEVVQGSDAKKILIDHHQYPDDFCDITISYPDMSSTCELALRLIASAGFFGELNLAGATAFLTGMVTDTQNFSVNTNNPDIYELLERLLEKGCDKNLIIRKAFKERSYSSLKLESYALAMKMEILQKSRCALITLDRDELKKFNYEKGDTEGLVNRPLEIRGVVSSFFLREDPDCIKVSARSINDYPVSKVCEDLYGGGGHLMAAGGEFHGSLDECKNLLMSSISNYDRYIIGKLDKLDI